MWIFHNISVLGIYVFLHFLLILSNGAMNVLLHIFLMDIYIFISLGHILKNNISES